MISGSFATRDDDVAVVIATKLELRDRAARRARKVCPRHRIELTAWGDEPGLRCPWCGHYEATP